MDLRGSTEPNLGLTGLYGDDAKWMRVQDLEF